MIVDGGRGTTLEGKIKDYVSGVSSPLTPHKRYRGVSRNGDYFSDEYKQYLCFSVKFSSLNLTHRPNRQNWTDAQQETYDLIKSLHDGGMGCYIIK